MNIQDISDFLDLVKNPAKYEKALKDLKEEQQRLESVIKTVGKASELDKLRKEVLAKQEAQEIQFKEKQKAAELIIQGKLDHIVANQQRLEQELVKARQKQNDADAVMRSANDLKLSFDGRDKQLRKDEEFIASEKAKISALAAEYEEKVAKLRSVMA